MISWERNMATAQQQALRERKFVLVFFSKYHCAGCTALEQNTYPDPAVQELVAQHFVPLHLYLNEATDRPHFKQYRVTWTPTTAILDRRGGEHYQSPGFLPPEQFAAMLRVGLGRAMTGWARYDEAATLLESVADTAGSLWAAEALFWLGVNWYLQARKREPMMRAWRRLIAEHPASIWAARVPPNQETEPDIGIYLP